MQETRLWDEGRQCTYSMRKKEGLADYRYFPEPDLPPLELSEEYIAEARVGGVGVCGRGAWCGGGGGHGARVWVPWVRPLNP